MAEAKRKDLGTWDTAVALVPGLLLLFAQFPLMFTTVATLLVSLSVLAAVFAAFLLRAARGRNLPLLFLSAPISAWSIFWLASTMEVTKLLPAAAVVGGTLLSLLLVKLFPKWCV